MTRSPLVPCPGCARHVRALEPRCPFCAHDLAARATAPASAATAGARLTRAAIFAFGTTLAACGPMVTPSPDGASSDGAVADTCSPIDPGSPMARYGAPPPPCSPTTDAGSVTDPPEDTGGPMARYGAPPPPPADADVDPDPVDSGSPMARYGAPPPPADAGAPEDTGGPMARYGAPPPPVDAG